MRKPLIYLVNFLSITVLALGFLTLDHYKNVRAQTVAFQNSNASCQQEQVLCTSFGGNLFNCSDAESIACKNITGGADFNGDGFFDCAAASSNYPNTNNPDPVVSVLINSGNTGPCTGGVVSQLNPSIDYELQYFGNTSSTVETDLGSILVGNIGGGNFADFAVPAGDLSISPASNDMVTAFSVPGGGFGPGDAIPTNTATADWNPFENDFIGEPSDSGQRNGALLDCDGTGSLEAAIVGGDSEVDQYTISIMGNSAGVLEDVLMGDVFDTTIPFTSASPNPTMTLAVADFDGVNGTDVVVAISDNSSQDVIALCSNNGSCGYTCSEVIDVLALFPGQNNVGVNSIAAGDFDGDGNADIAVTTTDLDDTPGNEVGIHYFMGDGTGNFATPGIHVPYDPSNGRPFVLATGFFNNDDAEDLALSYEGGRANSNVGVFAMNAARAVTTTTLNYPVGINIDNAGGLDAVDLDHQGCDDIVSIASIDSGNFDERFAFVFLNEIVAMSAISGADQSASLNTATPISGASCDLTPDDPGAVVTQGWTLAPAAGATLAGADTLTPVFTATAAGGIYSYINVSVPMQRRGDGHQSRDGCRCASSSSSDGNHPRRMFSEFRRRGDEQREMDLRDAVVSAGRVGAAAVSQRRGIADADGRDVLGVFGEGADDVV